MMLSETPLNSSQLVNQAQTALSNKLPNYGAFIQNNLAALSQSRALESSSDVTSTQDSPTSVTAPKSECFPGFVNAKLKEEARG